MTSSETTVYVGMAGDLIHPGHLNLLEAARQLGPVTVGLLSDSAIASYKRRPLLAYAQRAALVGGLKPVDRVVPQDTLDVLPNLRRYRPAYFVHGDDWRTGVLTDVRDQVRRTLAQWRGELVEPPYTRGVCSSALIEAVGTRPFPAEQRRAAFDRAWTRREPLTIVGAGDARAARVAGRSAADALWLGPGRTSTAAWAGTGAFSTSELSWTLHELLAASELPLLVDVGSVRERAHLVWLVRTLDALGASCVVVHAPVDLLTAALALRERRVRIVAAGLDVELLTAVDAGVDALYLPRAAPERAVRELARHARSTALLVEARGPSSPRAAGLRGIVHARTLEDAAEAALQRAARELRRPPPPARAPLERVAPTPDGTRR